MRSVLNAILIVFAAALAASALMIARTMPGATASATIPGLAQPVSIAFDADAVPHIRAATDLDAATAIGYLHARDRMFQMELMRRVGSGRVSEIAGAATYRLDATMRTLGLRRRAVADFPLLPAHTQALLTAYSRGVNGWIHAQGRAAAPEFLLLGPPEPWTPIDSLLWGKTMALYLSGNYRQELDHLALAKTLTPAMLQQLWPPQASPLPPSASLNRSLTHLAATLNTILPRFPQAFTLPATASNEWAVDGAYSATGAPLLAGDPHLGFNAPGLWYLARIDTPGAILAGATSPGVPFVVLGRNGSIAWTLTTTGADTQDMFIETAVDATHYQTPQGPAAYVTHDETIAIAGAPARTLHVRETRHGPVISDLDPHAGAILAVAMASLAPADTAPAGLDALNRATSVAQAGAAAPQITSPVNNLLVADRHAIAQFTVGRVPIRASGDGENPVDGASGRFDWTGFAAGAQLPHAIAPASGHLLNANEPTAGPDFPVFLARDWYGDWRARRIRALLATHPSATVADFLAMQIDATSPFAQQLLPILLAVPPPDLLARQALGLLAGWHGAMAVGLPQPLIFNAWMQALRSALLARAHIPLDQSGPPAEFIAGALTDPASPWCPHPCTAVLQSSLTQALTELRRRYGADPAAWRWGHAHQAVFAHPLLGPIPLIGPLTTLRIAAPGDGETLDRGGMAPDHGLDFDSVHGASYRAVYDLADLDRSRYVITPGESGNMFSPHRADFLRRWRDGGTISLPASPAHISATLQLRPEPIP